MKTACKLAGLLALASLSVLQAQDARSHFHLAGPMESVLRPGVQPAPVTSGLPFAVVLTNAGASSFPSSFQLQGKGWTGSADLRLEGLRFADGQLTGKAVLRNNSGRVLEGLRLDVRGAVEEYQAKQEGKTVFLTREQQVSLASPLLFGDLPPGQESDAIPLTVRGITFRPETERVGVHGIVSGLAFLGAAAIPDLTVYEVDIDLHGRVYIGAGEAIIRTDADGRGAHRVVQREGCRGVAIDPRTSEILANCDNDRILRFAPDGKEVGRITAEANGIERPTQGVRIDLGGRIYNHGDDNRVIQAIARGRKLWTVPVESEALFDVDASLNLYACTRETVEMFGPEGQKLRTFAAKGDWRLGGVMRPRSVRVDRAGNVWVVEQGLGAEAPRITVFDREGRPIRAFGRGGKAPVEDTILPGQLHRPVDLAFGVDGRVYVLQGYDDGRLLMFQPF